MLDAGLIVACVPHTLTHLTTTTRISAFKLSVSFFICNVRCKPLAPFLPACLLACASEHIPLVLPARLLDDNREIYVPELQEVIRPHPHFMLFATQNPAGAYAGRKTLSRAFRSRFLELHIEDIPDAELAHILEQRCDLAPSYAKKLVTSMRELQRQRQVGAQEAWCTVKS